MIKNRLFSLLRPLAFISLFLFITSCSIKTVYNNLDWVLVGMIEDYVTLSSEQEADVEHQVASFFKWHKGTQLEAYARDMREMKSLMTTTTMDDAYAEQMFTMFMQHWSTLKNNIAPHMADMFLKIKPKQIEELFRNLEKENQEIQQEYAETTYEERMAAGGEKMVDNFEEWFGDLTPEQEEMLRAWPKKFKPQVQERMAFRKKWQAELKEVLYSDLVDADKRARLIDMIVNPEQFQSDIHKEKLAYNAKVIKSLFLTMDPTVLPRQRQHLAERLDYFIQNFEELAAEAKQEQKS